MTHKARKHTFGLMDLVDSGLDEPRGATHDLYCPLYCPMNWSVLTRVTSYYWPVHLVNQALAAVRMATHLCHLALF